MEFFERLGKRVHAEWKARNFDDRVFHEVAEAALKAMRPSEHVTPNEIVEWVHDAAELPPQGDLKNPFGNPPLVAYRGQRFYIEVLFWIDSTTCVHQHSFAGAFHVLEGSSLHSQYSFRAEHRYSERLLLGELELLSVERLRKGDTRVIRGGDAFIHSLFHLDRPSISVVVRAADSATGPQYSYLRSGVAVDPFYATDSCTRMVQTLGMLKTLELPVYERARKTIESADAFTAYHLLSWFGDVSSDEEYTRLLAELRSPHRVLVERMRAQRDEAAREQELHDRRKRIRSAEHRFFLALLLNIPSRKRILELVREAYPSAPPVKTVLRWVSELSETRLDDGRNALDIELPPSALMVLEHLIEGASDEQVLARLREEYEDVDERAQDVRDLCDAFRRSLVFRPLLCA